MCDDKLFYDIILCTTISLYMGVISVSSLNNGIILRGL